MSEQVEKRRVKRVHLDKPLRVVIGSIGSTTRYDLLTYNVSVNGFFLNFERPGRFPFTSSSILEVWLEIDSDTTVFFNGKVARVVKKEDIKNSDTNTGIAIKIVQISKEDDDVLRHFVKTSLEKEEHSQNSSKAVGE